MTILLSLELEEPEDKDVVVLPRDEDISGPADSAVESSAVCWVLESSVRGSLFRVPVFPSARVYPPLSEP